MFITFATLEVYKSTGNSSFPERVMSELAREADYINAERTERDDLNVIVKVAEAGTNESPVYDAIVGPHRFGGIAPIMHLFFSMKLSKQMS